MAAPITNTTHHRPPVMPISLAILAVGVVLFAMNLRYGSVSVPWADFWEALFGDSTSTYRAIILDYRLPQATTALLAGIGLSVSGLLMQTLFRNPLADPSLLGISSGSSLGVAFVVLVAGGIGGITFNTISLWSTFGITLAAFVGAFAVLLLILALSSRLKSMVSLVLVGIMIAYIAGSVTDILKFFSQKEGLHSFVIWGMGSFSNVGMTQMPFFALAVAVGIIASFLLFKTLNLLLLGERYAENLGVNIKRSSMLIILVSGFLTAIITAFCGPIAFLGLAVPHIARFLFQTSDHKLLIPATAFLGMDLALFCNLISRLPSFDGNLPINSVTALIGAPIVLWVIFHRQKVLK
ncbi:MAG: iron ABC transporter permease [Bacteroidales bacterium]|nr:iron ABC transporter permease [Bacteroidales bacterium]